MTKKLKGRRHQRHHQDLQHEQFVEQLKGQGLVIEPIAGDGDCMFASIADQLNLIENKKRYVKAEIREQTVNYILKNSNEFSAFMVDDTVENYCCLMRKAGRWGGHIELQAAVHVYRCNIVIHQFDRARFLLRHPDPNITTAIHLSYHDGEHYASCRPISGQHQPITEPADPQYYKRVDDGVHSSKSNDPRHNEDSADDAAETDQKPTKDESGNKKDKGRRITRKERKILKKQEKIRLRKAPDKNAVSKESEDKAISEIVERLGTVLI